MSFLYMSKNNVSFLYTSKNNGLFAFAGDALQELQKDPTFLSVSYILINVVHKSCKCHEHSNAGERVMLLGCQ